MWPHKDNTHGAPNHTASCVGAEDSTASTMTRRVMTALSLAHHLPVGGPSANRPEKKYCGLSVGGSLYYRSLTRDGGLFESRPTTERCGVGVRLGGGGPLVGWRRGGAGGGGRGYGHRGGHSDARQQGTKLHLGVIQWDQYEVRSNPGRVGSGTPMDSSNI